MNFLKLEYLPFLIIAFLIFTLVVIYFEKRFFQMIHLYWFKKRSFFSYLSTFCFCLGIGTLLFSLLDARGPEEKIKAEVPTERTIILMDTSASMLAEDVRPSRLEKAVLIAKHFARKAAGHQLAIVAFAEIQKKIVPFTNDLDLIDARLDSIKELRNQNGSSALSQAIQESIQYFKETGEARGNILVLTDGEETSGSINLKIPKEIHVAFVGIGTAQGGRIPLDDSRGFRFGYKKSKGQDVITKLNENFFKATVADIPSAKYWTANTYNLPSDEIIAFFQNEMKKGQQQQDLVIRPVMMEWLVVPGVMLLIASYLFKAIRIFSLVLIFIVLPVKAQEAEISPHLAQQLQMLRAGDLNQLEKIKLADDLYKEGVKKEALALYEESLPKGKLDKNIPPEAFLNYGTALLQNGQEQKGLDIYQDLSRELNKDSKLHEMMHKNVVSYFQQKEQKQKQKKNQDNQDQKDDQDKKESGEQGKSDESKSGQNKQQKKDGKSGNEENDSKKEKNEQKNKDNNKDDSESEQDKQNKNDDKDEASKKLPPKKIPAKLKQLMSDDRQLQMKMIEQGTRDLNRRKSGDSKDW
jgi:Ca-activated chloride channel homolog